ncbi:IclR family transcriptional regulator [Pseudoxanthomonas sp. GM95]|uniref:IclR family transcriptional regulator n=1 Tax=Pseudoxanthomonas sp. GM95 TaxID=1881043 RepID=UPI000A4AF34A|nr:IclR family transcriptional regulator [Pseudoxanthomonas sp. GM95]
MKRSSSTADADATDTLPDDGATPTAIVSLKIIEALVSTSSGMGVTQLGQLLGMPKARMHRHLTVLREHGYVTQDPRTSTYQVGWQLYLLGQACSRHFDIMSLAKPMLERLRDKIGQTVVVSSFTGSEVVVIDVLRGTSPVEISLRQGTRFALNSVAQGKIVLAYGPSALLEETLEGPLKGLTQRTITDPDRLRSEVDLVKRRGWADAPEELYTGINALAAPVFQADGSLFGTIAIVGSIHYLPSTADLTTIADLRQTAAQISEALGHQA